MEYIKIKFGNELDSIGSRFETTLEQMFRTMNPGFSLCSPSWTPPMDIFETKDAIIIRADMAGVKKEDMEVEINSKAVRIYGKRSELTPAQNGTYRLAEIQYGAFERILFLPAPVDTEIVNASYVNGFLQITLAKLPMDTVHKIPISEE
uniref:Hsp20/alpha crystallin family protein n=1 Tax=Desulfatirhabdium butyrativorans TaxID=340467 RepID=A0A7C4VQH2_9BACT